MNSISLEYCDLDSAALVRIFQLSDLLQITAKEAAKIWIVTRSKAASQKGERAGK